MNKIYFGRLETSSFSFQSFGSTKEEATQAMREVWEAHVVDIPGCWTFDEVAEVCGFVVEVALTGRGYGGYGRKYPQQLPSKKLKLTNSNADNIFMSYVYSLQVDLEPEKSVKLTAETLGVDVSKVHIALKLARRKEWITSAGRGRSGGTITMQGECAIKRYEVLTRFKEVFSGSSA